MPIPDKSEVRPEEQELRDEALEEVAGGMCIPDSPVVEICPPPFFPEYDSR